jgi:NADPH:quinone reductase-like Zn-dependent oxidoreductase
VFDTVGNHGLLALRRVLEPKGTLVSIGGNKKDNWIGPVWGMAKRKIVDSFVDEELAGFIAEITTPDLDYLAGLATEGKLRSVIDKRYPLEETPAALEYIGGRHARGKVVINVE